jgi:hypothetical protein
MDGLELRARLFELGGALRVDQAREIILERAIRIVRDLAAIGLDIDGPAMPQAPEHIVGARRERDQLFRRRRAHIRPAEPAVAWNEPSLLRTTPGATSMAQGR